MNIYTNRGRENIKFLYKAIPFFGTITIIFCHLILIPYFLGDIFTEKNFISKIQTYFYAMQSIFVNLLEINSLKDINSLPKNEIAYLLSIILTIIIITIPYSSNPMRKLYKKLIYNTTATFATKETIIDAKLEAEGNKGILLGYLDKRAIVLKETMGIIMIAPPGSGKTQTLIRMIFKAKENSIVAVDIKKELYNKTSKERAKFSKVMKLEFDPEAENSISWNPFRNTPEKIEQKETYIDRIAGILFGGEAGKGGKDDFFTTSGKQLFQAIAKATIELKGNTTITKIIKEIQSTAEIIDRKTLTKDARTPTAIAITSLAEKITLIKNDTRGDIKKIDYLEGIISSLNELANQPNETFGGILQTFNTKTKIFTQAMIQRLTSDKNSLDFDDLRGIDNKPVTLYLIIKQEDVETFAPLVRLFFEMLTAYFLSKEEAPTQKSIGFFKKIFNSLDYNSSKNIENIKKSYPITLAIDEFTRHGKLEKIGSLAQLSRSMRLQPIIITQTMAQLQALYGKEVAENIVANSYARIHFTINEDKLATELSKMIGTYEVKEKEQQSRANFFSKGASQRITAKAVPLFSPQDLKSIPPNKQLLLLQGLGNKVFYIDRLALYGQEEEKLLGKIDEKDLYRYNTKQRKEQKLTQEQILEFKENEKFADIAGRKDNLELEENPATETFFEPQHLDDEYKGFLPSEIDYKKVNSDDEDEPEEQEDFFDDKEDKNKEEEENDGAGRQFQIVEKEETEEEEQEVKQQKKKENNLFEAEKETEIDETEKVKEYSNALLKNFSKKT